MSELIEEIKEISPNHKVVFVTAGEDFISRKALYISSLLNAKSSKLKETSSE
jgi:hypothetical protein